MINTNTPRDHHFVPKCYLNSFTDFQKKFWKRRVDNNAIVVSNPSKVCYEIDANKIRNKAFLDINNIDDENYIERHSFKRQESNFSKIVEQVNKFTSHTNIINKELYRLFLETLITIKRRNPSSKNQIINGYKERYSDKLNVESFLSFLSQELGISNFSDEMRSYVINYLETESKNPDRLHDMYLSAFINKIDYTTIQQLTDDFFQLKQYILRAPIGQQFITSDNPGFTISGGQTLSLGGFGARFQFYFPLSPSTCLYISSEDLESKNVIDKTLYHIFIDKPQIDGINSSTFSIAIKNIFALSKDVLKYVRLPLT